MACIFLHLQEGDAPLEMKYAYPSTLGHVVLEYIWLWIYLQNCRSGGLHFPAPSGGRRPLEMKYIYPSTLGHVVSEYIGLWWSISKTLGGVREQTNRQTVSKRATDLSFLPLNLKFRAIKGESVYQPAWRELTPLRLPPTSVSGFLVPRP